MKSTKFYLSFLCAMALLLAGCRTDDPVITHDTYDLGMARDMGSFAADEPIGFYLLNQGNMGSNKATIDYADYVTGQYLRNIFAERNPSVVKELGDVGNDIAIYGDRLYAVINGSHKVEVMDMEAHRLGQVDIPNCRYIVFSGERAYVSSFVGDIDLMDSQVGAVYEFDIHSLEVTRTVSVGYQPEQMVVVGGKIYVVNSGGYVGYEDPGKYEKTVSVVDIGSMSVEKTLTLPALNLMRIAQDGRGRLWVLAQGNYVDVEATLLVSDGDEFLSLDLPCSNFCIAGDRLYYYTNKYAGGSISYNRIDISGDVVANDIKTVSFISGEGISNPYLIACNPYSGDVLIGDAKGYTSSGTLSCYTPEGTLLWRVATGDIPAAVAFRYN